MARRRFGRVRQLPSGRWQGRYRDQDGKDRPAPYTFATKTDADRWLIQQEAALLAGDWLNPDAGRVLFKDYAQAWLSERPGLRLKTIERYECVIRLHLVPYLGAMQVCQIKEPHIRRWRKQLVEAGVGEATLAKAYRVLKSIMATAVGDELIKRNPCQIKGAGQEHAAERPVLSVAQVYALADTVGTRYRALILLTTFANLRWGEVVALRRSDIDLDTLTVTVRRQLIEVAGTPLHFGPPKTDAGFRKIPIPKAIRPALTLHLESHAQPQEDGLLFTGTNGLPLRRGSFRRSIWFPAINTLGLKGIRFHDLRHTGSTLAAIVGATLPELMERMGHSSSRAAMIYLHSTEERHQEIANALSAMARDATKSQKKKIKSGRSGTRRARKRKR